MRVSLCDESSLLTSALWSLGEGDWEAGLVDSPDSGLRSTRRRVGGDCESSAEDGDDSDLVILEDGLPLSPTRVRSSSCSSAFVYSTSTKYLTHQNLVEVEYLTMTPWR